MPSKSALEQGGFKTKNKPHTMQQSIVFATGNANKVKEANEILAGSFQIISLQDIGCLTDLPETGDTLEHNALQKAHYVREHFNVDCFSEDTGLEIEALHGAPGVYSARYAGPECRSEDNVALVLDQMKGQENRRARFRTIIALLLQGEEHLFEGIVNGHILEAPSGTGGFGYDPIFVPQGYTLSFAEMDAEEKNAISHRGRAVAKLMVFLKG